MAPLLHVQDVRAGYGPIEVLKGISLEVNEGEIVTMQDLFSYQYQGERADGTLIGRHACTNFRPRFVARAQYYGLADVLLEAMGCQLN